MASDPRKRNWTFLIYPDSAPENWEEILESENLPAFVSPLHNMDVDEADNVKKKPHFHVVVAFRGKKTEEQVQEISDKFSGVKVLPVNDMRSICRYLCHMDNPEKAQYPVSEVKSYGGLDYLTFIESPADVDSALREILAWINEQGCDSFKILSDYAAEYEPTWFRVITSKRTLFLDRYLKSLDWTTRQQMEHEKKTQE